VFLKGAFIEVGVNINGAYGTSVDAPPGYHPKGPAPVSNTCYPSVSPTLGLGFVADPDKDGWTKGSPPYFGDYFLPGSPQEGWSVMMDGVQGDAWNTGTYPFSIPALTGKNISYNTAFPRVSTVWQGVMDSMSITQLTTLDTNTVYFTTYITLKNTSSVTKKNVFYLRTVDPDNEEPETGDFTTDNKIAYKLPNPKNRTLVSAVGTHYSKAYLGLGTLDCRAKCFIIKLGLSPTGGNLDSMYEANGGIGDTADYIYNTDVTGDYVNDVGIGLVFKLGDVPPGDSLNFAYAYVLRAADIDSAFLSTKPKWITGSDTAAHVTGDTASVCKNSTISLSVVNGAYFNWFWFPSANLDTNQGVTVHVKVGTTPQTIMAIGSTPSCAADTIIINLNPNLSPPPKVTDTIYYCQGAVSSPLTADGQNLRWYLSNEPSDTGTTVAPSPNTDSLVNRQYYVTQTVRGCQSDKSTITVVINPPLPPLAVSNNGPLCLGDTLMLSSAYSAGAIYQWTGPNGFNSNDENAVRANVVEADTGLYSVVATVNGCPSKASATRLLIDEVVASIGMDTDKVCKGDPVTIRFNGIAPDTGTTIYTWNFADGTVNSGSNAGPYSVTFDSVGSKALQLTVQNWRCSSNFTKNIMVSFAPPISYSIKKDVCVNDTTAVQVSNYSLQNALSLNWNYAGATVANGSAQGNSIVSWNTPGDKIISLSIDYAQCIASPVSDTIHVHSLPSAAVQSISRNDICVGDTITFTAPQGQSYSYVWKPAAYFQNASKSNNIATGQIQASGNIYLTVTDNYSCTATDSIYINTQPCCIVSLPSAFTPNGDGKNDVFRPITIGHHSLKVFRVVNRWGQTVFESNQENLGWDGKFNGVPQDMDTYFWYINYECDGKTMEEQGEVVLIR